MDLEATQSELQRVVPGAIKDERGCGETVTKPQLQTFKGSFETSEADCAKVCPGVLSV